MDYDSIIQKYPQLKEDIDTARALQESAASMHAKASYKEKQAQINALIPELIELAKSWDENKIRHVIVKMEVLRDEIISIERNSRAYDTMVEQIEKGDFDNSTSEE